jgi:hypothetical protein
MTIEFAMTAVPTPLLMARAGAGISSIGLMILRPARGDANKSGERRHVDESFDPLHGSSKRGAKVRS